MKFKEDFFNNLTLPKETVPNGSTIWENPNSDTPMNKIVHRKYYPLSNEKISELEKTVNTLYHTKVVFPKWYRDFLGVNNGLDLFFGAISLYGFQTINRTDPLHESPYSLYIENLGKSKKLGKNVIQIGSFGYDRSSIIIDTTSNNSKVLCVYNETDKIFCEWNSFEEFFVSETKRLQDLYGKKPWGILDMGSNTLPNGHKDKN